MTGATRSDARRYRIRCGDAIHVVTMDDEGRLDFHGHPSAFAELDAERAMAALAGEALPGGTGCLRLALLVRQADVSTPAVHGGDDARRLLAAVRGIRIARRLRREA